MINQVSIITSDEFNDEMMQSTFYLDIKNDVTLDFEPLKSALNDYMKHSVCSSYKPNFNAYTKKRVIYVSAKISIKEKNFDYKLAIDTKENIVLYEELSGNISENYKTVFIRNKDGFEFKQRKTNAMIKKLLDIIRFDEKCLFISLFNIIKDQRFNLIYQTLINEKCDDDLISVKELITQ